MPAGYEFLFGSQKATMKLKLKALPVFDKEKGAIYLQEMEVVDATVTPEKMQSVLQTLLPYLNQSLRSYFNQRPAYVLREDSSKGEALAKKLAKGIEVKPVKSLFLSPIDFGGRARALFYVQTKTFPLILCFRQKTIPQPELINDCTIRVLKIRRPDDWHVHLRDGDMLKTVVPYTSEIYGRAIVMPNPASPSRPLMQRSPTASVFSMRCPPGMISRR